MQKVQNTRRRTVSFSHRRGQWGKYLVLKQKSCLYSHCNVQRDCAWESHFMRKCEMFSDTKEYKMSIFCCCSNSPFTSPTSKDCFTINSHFPTFSSFLLPAKPCYHIFRVCFESACFLLARLFKQEGRWKRKAALLKAWEATGRKVQEPFLR